MQKRFLEKVVIITSDGCIMAADHSFHNAIPAENIRCVINSCKKIY